MLAVIMSPFIAAPVPTVVTLVSPFLPQELTPTSSGVPVICRKTGSATGSAQWHDYSIDGMLHASRFFSVYIRLLSICLRELLTSLPEP